MEVLRGLADPREMAEYIRAKIEMLTDKEGFNFHLAPSDITKLESARSEIQCDQIAHGLFNKYM